MKVTVLRISNPYGPMQIADNRTYGIANRFIQSAVKGEKIRVFGDGMQRRDYLYIDDLVDVFFRAAYIETSKGKIYNIGNVTGTTLLELAEMAVAASGCGEIVRSPWPEEYCAVETGDYRSDIELARKELGWSPFTGILEGIARTVAFYRGEG
jgi:nucleoside-diphosphate-sugar epimerase